MMRTGRGDHIVRAEARLQNDAGSPSSSVRIKPLVLSNSSLSISARDALLFKLLW